MLRAPAGESHFAAVEHEARITLANLAAAADDRLDREFRRGECLRVRERRELHGPPDEHQDEERRDARTEAAPAQSAKPRVQHQSLASTFGLKDRAQYGAWSA